MENEKLKEMRTNLNMLPILEERAKKLKDRIYESEDEVRSLLRKYEAESLDVERLEKDSLSTTLLRFIGKYEDKLDKESQEMLDAKMEYDRASDRVKELYNEQNELNNRISILKTEKETYEAELKRREEIILYQLNDEVSKQYKQLEEESKTLTRQLIEMDEAIRAARRVRSTAESALSHLESAEGWATYDVWSKGGIISHMAKYDHIDHAEAAFNRLHSQIKDLKKELSDIDVVGVPEVVGIDGTTRAFDFWFDNIFTDWNVRDRIRNSIEEIRTLDRKIDRIISNIKNNKSEVHSRLESIDQSKKELIITL